MLTLGTSTEQTGQPTVSTGAASGFGGAIFGVVVLDVTGAVDLGVTGIVLGALPAALGVDTAQGPSFIGVEEMAELVASLLLKLIFPSPWTFWIRGKMVLIRSSMTSLRARFGRSSGS